jgi:hypothetical protein
MKRQAGKRERNAQAPLCVFYLFQNVHHDRIYKCTPNGVNVFGDVMQLGCFEVSLAVAMPC